MTRNTSGALHLSGDIIHGSEVYLTVQSSSSVHKHSACHSWLRTLLHVNCCIYSLTYHPHEFSHGMDISSGSVEAMSLGIRSEAAVDAS